MHAHVKLVSLKILCWLLMDICLVSVEWSDQHDVCFIYILNIIIQLYNYAIELMLKNPPDKYWSVGIIPPKQAPVSICFPNRLKRSIEMIWPILRRGSVSLKWGYPNKNWKPGFHETSSPIFKAKVVCTWLHVLIPFHALRTVYEVGPMRAGLWRAMCATNVRRSLCRQKGGS